MTVFFTGSRGELGSALLARFARDGAHCLEADLSMPGLGGSRLIHLAARLPTTPIEQQIESNLVFLRKVSQWVERESVPELIFFSTNSIYQNRDGFGVDENSGLIEPDIYALTKYLGEKILQASKIRRVLCLRLPGFLEIKRSTAFVSHVFDRLMKNQEVELFNSNLPFNNFISVEEVYRFMRTLRMKEGFDVLNIAVAPQRTLGEIVRRVRNLLDSKSEIIDLGLRKPFFNVSIEKLRCTYGFEPAPVDRVLEQWCEERRRYLHLIKSATSACL